MQYRDLRTWLNLVAEMGELKIINGANWDLEIGVLAEHVMRAKQEPAVIFDQIVDYPAGYRILINESGSRKRAALTLGLPVDLDEPGLIQAWREKRKSIRPIPPEYVKDGAIFENVLKGDDIDMWKFPTPRWHEHDGGRYLGTGDAIITRDRENNSMNMGTYRVMVHDKGHIFVYISPSHDGRIHRDKWFANNEPMPVVAVFGMDPLLHMVGGWSLPHGQFEIDFAGGIKGEPIRVVEGPVTGLPIPADAEIAVEGFVMPDDRRPEGPFGEWTGYYGSGAREEPVVQVKALYHRNDPIILGSPPVKPPSGKVYM
ncbi:MAG: UbiD family decarboxylase, partial [Deltaproteobacteria bacterium]|nr:UbiD family decarboxylase [Deltaproteobacteria bacterium]